MVFGAADPGSNPGRAILRLMENLQELISEYRVKVEVSGRIQESDFIDNTKGIVYGIARNLAELQVDKRILLFSFFAYAALS